MKLLDSVRNRIAFTGLLLLPAIIYAFTTAGNNFSGKPIIKEATLPEEVGTWHGRLEPLTDTELNVLHSPSASQRIYQNDMTGDVVQVLIIQVENTQNAHDPRLCMDGSGYAEKDTREEPAPWADSHASNDISHSIFSKDGIDLHMYYWMSTRDGTVANMSTGLKLSGFWKALWEQAPTRGMAVRVLGRPNVYEPTKTTDPETLKKLWQEIRAKVDFQGLVAKQG